MTFRPWLQKSTKPVPGGSIWWLSGHGSRSRKNQSQEAWLNDFRALDPGINKTMVFMHSQWSDNKMFPDLILCWYREPIRQNESQETRFNDFSALAQEVNKTNPKRLDLMIFWPWLQMSTKPVPGGSIWWLSGHGSRSRQNQSQEARFDEFLATAPEVVNELL